MTIVSAWSGALRRLGLLLAVLLIAAPGAAQARVAGAAGAITVTDDHGTSFTLPRVPERLISLAPSDAEILYALGLGREVVAVGSYTTYPAPAAKKEVVFSYTGMKAERIVTLRPDLIVAAAGIVSPQQVTKLRSLHLAVLVLDPHNLNDIYHDIALVGQATGKATAADLVVAGMKTRVSAITNRMARAATHPRVYYELDATGGYYTAGPGSYIDTLVRLAGGTNIAGTARVSYVKLNGEALLTANPQVILLGDAAYGTTVAAVGKRAGWSRISAVADGRVYPINDDLVSRPGPRIVDGLETIAHLLHPELFTAR